MDAWGVSAVQWVWLPGRMMGSDPPPLIPHVQVFKGTFGRPHLSDAEIKVRRSGYSSTLPSAYSAAPLSASLTGRCLSGLFSSVFAVAGAPLSPLCSSPSARPPLQEHLSVPSSPFMELHMGELLPHDAAASYLQLMGQPAITNATETKTSSVHE